MKYVQPYDQPSVPDAPYVDLDAAHGVDGSIPPAKFFNDIQAELLDLIDYAGLTPDAADLTQVRQAILALLPAPGGGPSDASLVHFGVDVGAVNAPSMTPSPVATSVSTGFTIFFLPTNDSPGPATIEILLDGGGSVVKNLKRGDNSALQVGDVKTGRLICAQYDGVQFRIVNTFYGVKTDGNTITGDGTPGSPLIASVPTFRFGTEVGQYVTTGAVGALGATPFSHGYYIGMTASGAQLDAGTVSGVTATQLKRGQNVDNGYWNGANLTGTWRLDETSWGSNEGFATVWELRWRRIA